MPFTMASSLARPDYVDSESSPSEMLVPFNPACGASLAHGFFDLLNESVHVGELACSLPGVQEDSLARVVLSALVESDFEPSRDSVVAVQVVLEAVGVLLLDLLDRSDGVSLVASPSAVLELDHVRGV